LEIDFIKYHGAGNDFIMIDNYHNDKNLSQLTKKNVESLCHRQFGIGADGLIILQNHENYDFEMIYYNSDGGLSSMCGNGGRCIIHLAHSSGYIGDSCFFLAADGRHEGKVRERIELKMQPVSEIEKKSDNAFFVDTGSPHYIKLVDSVESVDLVKEAHAIRYNDEYKVHGTNVNFVEVSSDNKLAIRTYERGVEGETLACGTGIVAASLVHNHILSRCNEVIVNATGGRCSVRMDKEGSGWKNIWLIGPAQEVYRGTIEL